MRNLFLCFVFLSLSRHSYPQQPPAIALARSPVVIIAGTHELDKAAFEIINSQKQADRLFAKALSNDDFLRAQKSTTHLTQRFSFVTLGHDS